MEARQRKSGEGGKAEPGPKWQKIFQSKIIRIYKRCDSRHGWVNPSQPDGQPGTHFPAETLMEKVLTSPPAPARVPAPDLTEMLRLSLDGHLPSGGLIAHWFDRLEGRT